VSGVYVAQNAAPKVDDGRGMTTEQVWRDPEW